MSESAAVGVKLGSSPSNEADLLPGRSIIVWRSRFTYFFLNRAALVVVNDGCCLGSWLSVAELQLPPTGSLETGVRVL